MLRLRDKITIEHLIGNHTQSYRMVPISMTLSDLWPRFQGHNIFSTLNIIYQKRHKIEP